jgi:hypothetical protein
MSEIIDALERELRRLEAELAQDPRYRRVGRIRELLSDYRTDESPTLAPTIRARTAIPGAQEPSKATLIRTSVRQHLQEKAAPVHRGEILEHLTARGFMEGQKNPMASLAAYLSEWRDEFEPDGRGNWALKSAASRQTN